MLRASQHLRAAAVGSARVIDRVVLGADERHRRRIVIEAEGGTKFLLDLPHATALRDGDGLVLEDGSVVLVEGKPEPVVDIAAANASELARLAWHLGNRHTEVQIIGETLRIRADHVLEKMLAHLGASLVKRDAPFDPESGAYGQAMGQLGSHGLGRGGPAPGQAHTHGHSHGHAHDHAHDQDHAHPHSHKP
ncbi:MAG: urease accessory protein UreE [Rhizobiales bacterium]|nr:urease accessory protein UreE [Hyphomicrobiales bacterium]